MISVCDSFSEIMSRISSNPWIRLRELSAQIGIGHKNLQRIVKQAVGMRFHQVRQVCRLCRSIGWLVSGMSVKSVALTCGYRWSQDYTRAFKVHFGLSPSALSHESAGCDRESQKRPCLLSVFSCPFGSNAASCHRKTSNSSSSH